jgi:hypothetical protein
MSSSGQKTPLICRIPVNRCSIALLWQSFSSQPLWATWVRFDIAFAVSQLARFCVSAGSSHWAALHHLMEYLAGTPSFKITYRRSKGSANRLSGYADASWGNSCSLRSTSGALMLCNKAPIMWKSKWCNKVICGRERAKHNDVREYFAHEVIRNGEMKLIKVSTTSQLADILTICHSS